MRTFGMRYGMPGQVRATPLGADRRRRPCHRKPNARRRGRNGRRRSPAPVNCPRPTVSLSPNGGGAQAETTRPQNPFTGHLFVFRGRRGDLIKTIRWNGQGACLFSKRLEKGRLIRQSAKEGKIAPTAAQLAMLPEGIDWRSPHRSWTPLTAG
jgi:transposase